MTWFWVERLKDKVTGSRLGLSAIRHGFELHECLLVIVVKTLCHSC